MQIEMSHKKCFPMKSLVTAQENKGCESIGRLPPVLLMEVKLPWILIPAGAAAVFYIAELYSPGCKSTNQEIKTSDFWGLFYCEHNQSCARSVQNCYFKCGSIGKLLGWNFYFLIISFTFIRSGFELEPLALKLLHISTLKQWSFKKLVLK